MAVINEHIQFKSTKTNFTAFYKKFVPCFLLVIIFSLAITSCGTIKPQRTDSGSIQIDSLYWKYKGEKTLLLGAFNHGHNPFIDGSTMDTVLVDGMDKIVAQIQEMVDAGGNTLRCVLDPGSAAVCGIESYYRDSLGRYDLNKPAGTFWRRLSTFIAEAEKRDVIVELEIWDRFDWQGINWELSPFNPKNNINYSTENSNLETNYERSTVYSKHPFSKGVPGHPVYNSASSIQKKCYDRVRKYQEIFIKKVYLNSMKYHNVIYNMNNETSENPAWGEYWIKYIKSLAESENVPIICTNMQDDIYRVPNSKAFTHQLNHHEIYDYIDVSQANSRLRDEGHWNTVSLIGDQAKSQGFLMYMTKLYGSDYANDNRPWAGFKQGDSDNAIEEWWRDLIAGVAGVRFHRPYSGLGLCEKSKACIQATRKIESKIKFWEVRPGMNLLSGRDDDEAYLAADPGRKYILYFTHLGGGSVGLNLKQYNGVKFKLNWVNIDTGSWGEKETINGGSIVTIKRPDDSAHWVAAIYRNP